jgi:DUF1365 family protein
MNSAIYVGTLAHARTKPKKNAFSYSVFMFYLDLDELPTLHRRIPLFSLNRFNVFSFFDADHFKFISQKDPNGQVISRENVDYRTEDYLNENTRDRIARLLRDAGMDFSLGKVFLLTNPRVFGYVFNPVSFYYCFDEAGAFRAMLSEVNNTFGDQKMFVCPIADPNESMFTSRQRKNFYVSPFTDYDNDFAWRFGLPGESVFMTIDSLKAGETELKTSFTGRRRDFSEATLLHLTFRYPLLTLMIIFRIHYQALKLFLKKVRHHDKVKTDAEIAKALSKK